MKKYNILWILIALFISISCEEDLQYVAPNSFSDVTWVNGFSPEEARAVNIHTPKSFMDLSQGIISHKWSIEKGNYFLANEFDERVDSIFTEYILGDDTITNEALASILFTQPGLSKVRLYNTFPDSVSWWGSRPLNAEKKGDVWVIDTTFLIDVYDSIKPAFDIFKGEELLYSITSKDLVSIEDSANWALLELESGEQLTYVDMTEVGRPNNRGWSFKGGDISYVQDSSVTVSYYYLGKNIAGKLNSSRAWPNPIASQDKYIPLKIKVGASEQPFNIVGDIVEDEDEKLSFSVTGVLETCIGEEANFVVHVENTEAGFSGDIEVQSATINANNKRQIDLILKEPIYNSDIVTVKYKKGNIRSLDERVLESFEFNTVKMHMVNAINSDVFGFEIAPDNETANDIAQGWWLQHPGSMSRSDEQAAVGSYSLKIATVAKSVYTLHGGNLNVSVAPPAGKYLYRAKVWKDSSSTVTGLRVNLSSPWMLNVLNLDGIETNKWVQCQKTITTNDPITKLIVQLHSGETDGLPQLLYLDDIQLIPVESRPVK